MRPGATVRLALALLAVTACAAPAPASPATDPLAAAATATATATASATAAAEGTPNVVGARRLPTTGPLEAGRYFVPAGRGTPVTFSFEAPAGWSATSGRSMSKHADESGLEIGWGVSTVARVFADPCGENDAIDVGPAADDLVNALLALPGLEVSGPSDVTIGDRTGTHLDIKASDDINVDSCDPPIGLQVWRDNDGDYLVVGQEAPARIRTADVDGGRFLLVATSSLNRTVVPSDMAELESMLASIRFEP